VVKIRSNFNRSHGKGRYFLEAAVDIEKAGTAIAGSAVMSGETLSRKTAIPARGFRATTPRNGLRDSRTAR